VCFSGDKLLGGPQAGIIAGKRAALERVRKHPLARALRADKGTLAALAATLLHYARGEALSAIPIWRMIALPLDEIERRARRVADALHGWGEARGVQIDLVNGTSTIGGGSLPGETLPTWLIALRSANAADLAAELRAAGVIARIQDERVLLDLRTVIDDVDLIQKFSN
jgi:L-seryl-tRNA(Ser) seleniumtransferase